MIVPGEASESDEDVVVGLPAAAGDRRRPHAVSPPPPATTSRGAGLANQLSATLHNVTDAMSKQLQLASRQGEAVVLGRRVSSSTYDGGEQEAKSLLHEKLCEKNASLKSSVDQFVEGHIAKVPRDLAALLGTYSKTQVFIQDSVLSMQQANHFCAETLESIDDFVEIGSRIRFPE